MYTTFDKTDRGLRITLTAKGKNELAALQVEQEYRRLRNTPYQRTSTDMFYDLIDEYLGNGWMLITPEQIGALTSNPYMLSDDGRINDMGNLGYVGTIYAFDNYQIQEPLDLLEQNGFVDFTAYRD